jgi:hypothetical protein
MARIALPDISSAINAWSQKLEFMLVGKEIQDYETVEVLYPKKARGVRQPMKPQDLEMKPAGERAWKWETIHATPSLLLNVDDIVVFDHVRYRVMAKKDYAQYGYVEYDICQDYQQ